MGGQEKRREQNIIAEKVRAEKRREEQSEMGNMHRWSRPLPAGNDEKLQVIGWDDLVAMLKRSRTERESESGRTWRC